MNVVILADTNTALREQQMLSRVESGLAGEGVLVAHAVPESADLGASHAVFRHVVTYEDAGLPGTLGGRARRLEVALRKLPGWDDTDQRSSPVVHGWGVGCRSIAAELARLMGATLGLEVFRLSDARMLSRGAGHGAAFLTSPDAAILRAVSEERTPHLATVVPWGVHSDVHPHGPIRDDATITAILVCSGADGHACRSAVEGFASWSREHAQSFLFVDSAASRVARLWPVARKLGLTDRLTVVPDLEAQRDLTLRADFLLLPEALGDWRSITLDAMASGMPIIAANDPHVGVLRDRQTARLVAPGDASLWAAALGEAVGEPERTKAIASFARDQVRQSHRVSTHIAGLLDVYERAIGRDSSLAFSLGSGSPGGPTRTT